MCVIVDEFNTVIGAQPRAITVRERLLGRGSYVLVFNCNEELFVSKRSSAKDVYPGHLDVVISGVVNEGEEYSDTACRELHEEVGVPPATSRQALQHLFLFPYRDDTCHVWGSAFTLQYDGDVKLQQEEVDWGQFMPLQQVQELLEVERFTPVGRHILQLYLQQQ